MAYSNYEDVLAQLQAAGLQVERLEFSRLTRCQVDGERGRPGWYILHDVQSGGDMLIVGSYGIWQGSDNNAQKIAVRKTEMTAEQRASLKKRLRDDRREADQARKREAERAALRASAAWSKCEPTGENEYLQRKGVQAHGLRFSPSGACVVPMLDTAGIIHGLQVIRPPSNTGRKLGKQTWPQGAVVKGHFHLIGTPGRVLLIAEGYATGASLHEATGLPVAIAFSANNLAPVAAALANRYKTAKQLICADNDRFRKCRSCKARFYLPTDPETCTACGDAHQCTNPGVSYASAAALETGGQMVAPQFANEDALREAYITTGAAPVDYNDLHMAEGLHVVRTQIEARLSELGWERALSPPPGRDDYTGGGDATLQPISSMEQLLSRFSLVYAMGGAVFDHQEHCMMKIDDLRDACVSRQLHRAWMDHPDRQIVRKRNVGFDPTEHDSDITCNLWSGWETTPAAGKCECLLELLEYMCSNDSNAAALYEWVLNWIAYPLQHPGAKMKTALVLHGPQGVGKNQFFETLMSVYGRYGCIIDQDALEDKHNDWASRKLFMIADEVLARSELFKHKNKLKNFITGDNLRINPKHIQGYTERNHVNMVFLSNEPMPVVLESDDRRHAIIWTPPKLPREFYAELQYEIENGGAAALHETLLHRDLGDFGVASAPPKTEAKDELINLALDSTSRFYHHLRDGEIESIKPRPALSSDVYDLYRVWCKRLGTPATSMPKLINALNRKHGVKTERKRYVFVGDYDPRGPHSVMYLAGKAEPDAEQSEARWLGTQLAAFRTAVDDYQGRDHV